MERRYCDDCGRQCRSDSIENLCTSCAVKWSEIRTNKPEWARTYGAEYLAHNAASNNHARESRTDKDRQRSRYQSKRPKLFKALVKRDGERCRHCGTSDNLTVDHILAINNGGSDDLVNLQILCRSCNARKGDR